MSVAMDLMWENSYMAVGVDDICKRAGVAKGSFYFAFPSKADLTIAALEERWKTRRPLLDHIFSSAVPPLQRIENYARAVLADQKYKFETFGKVVGCPFASIGSEVSTQNEKIRQRIEAMMKDDHRYFERLVQDLSRAGLVEVDDTAALAEELCNYVIGVLVQAKIDNSLHHVENLKHGILRHLGIVGQQAVAQVAA